MTTVALFVHRVARPLEELTGIGRYAVELCHALVERNAHEYVLVAPFDDDPPPGAWPDVPLVRVGGDRRILQARWRLLGRPRLDHLVAGIDLVHAVSPTVPVPTRTPFVVTVHDLFPLDQPQWKSWRGRWLFHGALDHAAEHAARVIAPSRHVARQVVERLGVPPERVSVVAEGVDPRFHQAVRDDGAVAQRLGLPRHGYLLALGSVSSRKNLQVVVEALANLAANRRPVLGIAGPAADARNEVAELVARRGLQASVVWAGFVPDDDLPSLVAGARALVHPSLDEGFGLPVAEALAAGTPVLASRVGALPELVGDAGRLLPPRDPAAWAAAIAELARDDRMLLASRARERATQWTWQRTAQATEAVYEAALGRGGHR